MQWGAWELDVAYHLGAVLDVEPRRAHERELLAHYLDEVRRHGGTAPSSDAAWDSYRRALVYGFFMWGITQRVERPVLETFVQRLGSAVEDHTSFDRLGV